jgi:hypothetical protein
MTEKRNTGIFINGGAGRVISSIPALENFAKDNPEDDFIIICEGGTDFYKGHPDLYKRAYDPWHKNLFDEKLKNMNLVSPEPYRVWEYYNQKCSLAQAYDKEINKLDNVRSLQTPNIYLSKAELVMAQKLIKDIKEKTKKDKVIVFQPFGRGVQNEEGMIVDYSGRSFEPESVINIVKKLSKKFAVVFMAEIGIEFDKYDIKEPIAIPQNIDLRQWSAIINTCDYFLGCDSVGQHIAYSLGIPTTIVLGSTFDINVSYPNCPYFDILDMGEGERIYSPIRITHDEFSDRHNEGIMKMNEKIEEVIVESVIKNQKKWNGKPVVRKERNEK